MNTFYRIIMLLLVILFISITSSFSQCDIGTFSLPYNQNFEGIASLQSAGFSVINPDNSFTWDINNNSTGLSTGNTSLWMNNYKYNNGIGQTDTLVFPTLNFSGVTNPTLSFKYAYTRYTGYNTDSLIVLVSAGCNTPWIRVANYGENGSGNFATTGNGYGINTEFIPSLITDWCGNNGFSTCKNISLNSLSGIKAARIAFVAYNNYSNNLFIDDIKINGSLFNSITTGAVGISNCIGANIAIPFSVKGTFNQGNIFTAVLSDSTGSFIVPDTIGNLLATNDSVLTGFISSNHFSGTHYRIRINSTSPAIVGADNGVDITLRTIIDPQISITIPSTTVCSGMNALFTAVTTNAGNNSVYQWYKNGVKVGNSNSTYSDATLVDKDSIWCMLTSNAFCTSNNMSLSNKIVVNVNSSNQLPLPYIQDFETISSLQNAGINVINPDSSFTWDISNNTSGLGSGINALWINNYKYNNGKGQRDTVIFPPLNFSGAANPTLNFSHAYTKYQNFPSDSLIVLVSAGCSSNWIRIAAYGENGSGNFATTGTAFNTNSNFFPKTATDWCGNTGFSACKNIHLDTVAGQNGVRVAFVSYNNFSNNLFIDNININANLTNSILTGSVPSIVCLGSNLIVPYSVKGSFSATNTFIVQLSDSNGSFTNPDTIGTLVSNTDGNIQCTIPILKLPSNHYLIRVISTSPSIVGNSNGTSISLLSNVLPQITVSTASTNICSGMNTLFTTNVINAGSTPIYKWYKNGVMVGNNTSTYTDSSVNNNDSIWCVLTSNSLCSTVNTVTSNKLWMKVNKAVPVALPYYQGFEGLTTLENAGFSVINPDSSLTWTVNNNTPGLATGQSSLWINYYKYNNAIGQRDTIIFPPLNFTNVVPNLSFRHAYTRYTGYSTDSLIIIASTGCSTNWIRIAAFGENGTGNFATTGTGYGINAEFLPKTVTDWCGQPGFSNCKQVLLDKVANMNGVRLAFVSYNNFSNNLFLDDINISSDSINILVDSLSSIKTCLGSTVSIPFTVNKSFNAGNVFTAQLSDSLGNFNSPVNIGTLNAINSGIINAVIPVNTNNGYLYRIRVIASNPFVISTDNGKNISIINPVKRNIILSSCSSIVYKSVNYTSSTIVRDTIKSKQGCDSIYNITIITINPITASTNAISLNGCNNVVYKSVTYTSSTIVRDTLKSWQGCDSVYNIATITINPITASTNAISLNGCNNVVYKSVTYTSSTIVRDTLKSWQGCDSIYNIAIITVNPITASTNAISLSGCNNVVYKSVTYISSTIVRDTLKSWQGCDSVYNIATITVNPIIALTNAMSLSGCNNVVYKSVTYTSTTIVRDTIKSIQGCDSIYNITNITITPVVPSINTINLNGCDSLNYKSVTYTSSIIVKDTIKSIQGCDSIYNVATITISKTPVIVSISSNSPINRGDTIKLYANSTNGVTYNWTGPLSYMSIQQNPIIATASLAMAGTYSVSVSNNGCTSQIASLSVVVNSTFTLGGNIHTPQGKIISTIRPVTIKISGATTALITPDVLGNYSANVLAGANYIITPSKNNDIVKSNGISTIDAALVQSHILQKVLLNSPYKIIAADINGDGKVSALDIVFMKRLILATDTTFTKTSTGEKRLWAFIDSTYKFTDTTNPFPHKDSISYTNLSGNQTNQTFIGMKLGDVNWDWNPAVAKPYNNTENAVELSYSAYVSKPTDRYIHIPIKVKNFKEMMGMQFTLAFNADVLKFKGVENNVLNIEIGDNHILEGKLSMLWLDPKNEVRTLEDGTPIMILVFERINNNVVEKQSLLSLDGSITSIEAFDKDYQLKGVVMKPSLISYPVNTKESWVVTPNPIIDGVIHVQMNLTNNKTIVFNLFDNTGRELMNKKVEVLKGLSLLTLQLQNQLSEGIYYLQAIGMEGEEVKKVMVK